MNRILLFLHFLFLSRVCRSWDMAVGVDDKLQFLSVRGSVERERTINSTLKYVRSVSYDPKSDIMYLSGGDGKNYSILGFPDVTTRSAPTPRPLIESTEPIQAIAYDHVTEILFWTTSIGKSIKWISTNSLSNSSRTNDVKVFQHFTYELPQGIAVDSCSRYIYWTNCNHTMPSIERAAIKFTKDNNSIQSTAPETLVTKELFRPVGIVVDYSVKKLFWCDDKEGIYFSIMVSNLDGTNVEKLVDEIHHQPYSIAIVQNRVYYSDLIYNSLWSLPKNATTLVKPFKELSYGNDYPKGIVSKSSLSCFFEKVTSNPSEGFDVKTNNTTTPDVHSNKSDCTSVKQKCQNYCIFGTCSIKNDGNPVCVCSFGFFGDRCEKSICDRFCLNEGECFIKSTGEAACNCSTGYRGHRCEEKTELKDARDKYCLYGQRKVYSLQKGTQPQCSCPEVPISNSTSSIESCNLWQSYIVIIPWCLTIVLLTGILIMSQIIFKLHKRPRIRKRIIVNKNINHPLTSRPAGSEHCEITIENCCNMNICETPCYEPRLVTDKKSKKKEEKENLLHNDENDLSHALVYQDSLY